MFAANTHFHIFSYDSAFFTSDFNKLSHAFLIERGKRVMFKDALHAICLNK